MAEGTAPLLGFTGTARRCPEDDLSKVTTAGDTSAAVWAEGPCWVVMVSVGDAG